MVISKVHRVQRIYSVVTVEIDINISLITRRESYSHYFCVFFLMLSHICNINIKIVITLSKENKIF